VRDESRIAPQQGKPDDTGEGEEVRVEEQADHGRVDGQQRHDSGGAEQQHQQADHPPSAARPGSAGDHRFTVPSGWGTLVGMAHLTPIARSYPPGTTSWVEVAEPDLDAALAFYGDLLGWEFEDMLPPDAPARYVVATLGGLDVAALTGPADGDAAWSTYVAVDDADAVARAMVERGATLVSEPTDAGPEGSAGRSATLTDPQGAEVRLWQARRRLGAQVANLPGAWNFSDLRTSDPAAAGAFYADVLGWQLVDQGWATVIQVPGYGDHLAATSDPDIRSRQAHAPEGFADVIGVIGRVAEGQRPHWHVTFTVADRDAAADAVRRLGGGVEQTTEDDWTRKAVVRDPQGARFTVSQYTPPDR